MSDKLPKQYVTILQSAWMNSTGYGINYSWDGDRLATREEAIKRGWELRDSDDFNVGVIRGDKLVSFDWMNEPLPETPKTLREIAAAIGLVQPPRGERE